MSQRVLGFRFPSDDKSDPRIGDTDCFLEHRRKHRLEIAWRAANDFEHLRGRRLLLQRLIQLAGELRNLCPLASRN